VECFRRCAARSAFQHDGQHDVHLNYDDECLIFDLAFTKRYTSVLGDTGATGILFTITLKTVGTVGPMLSDREIPTP